MSLKFASQSKLLQRFTEECRLGGIVNVSYTYQHLEKLGPESNGRWLCTLSLVDTRGVPDRGLPPGNQSFEAPPKPCPKELIEFLPIGETCVGYSQKKEAQEGAILAFFSCRGVVLPQSILRSLGAVDRTRTGKSDRTRGTGGRGFEEDTPGFLPHLARPPGVEALDPAILDGTADMIDPNFLTKNPDEMSEAELLRACGVNAAGADSDDDLELLDLGLEDELGLPKKKQKTGACNTSFPMGAMAKSAGPRPLPVRVVQKQNGSNPLRRMPPSTIGRHPGSNHGVNFTASVATLPTEVVLPQTLQNKTLRTRNGEVIPRKIAEIQGLWVIPNPSRLPMGVGPFEPSQSTGSNSTLNGFRDARADDPNLADTFVIVEELSFRCSTEVERRRPLMLDGDNSEEASGSLLYLSTLDQSRVLGELKVDEATNNKLVLWSDSDQAWEPAVTPILPEELQDTQTYGFTLDNSKQNLNFFFQKKRYPMDTIRCDSLSVVPGFRASCDLLVSDQERIRLSGVSASKKSASGELAMRLCKMLCRRRLLANAAAMEQGAASKDKIVPDQLGLTRVH